MQSLYISLRLPFGSFLLDMGRAMRKGWDSYISGSKLHIFLYMLLLDARRRDPFFHWILQNFDSEIEIFS